MPDVMFDPRSILPITLDGHETSAMRIALHTESVYFASVLI